MLTRRSVLLGGMLAPLAAQAQPWPAIVKIVIPTAAGGALDAIARLLQPALQRQFGAAIVVENRPGASSTIGAAYVAKSPPDGGTWLFASDSLLATGLLLDNLPFRMPDDFEPVTMVAVGPMVLCTHPSRPYRTLADLVAAAKENPDRISCATTGTGGTGHLSTAALSSRLGIKLMHVPYRGGGPAVIDAVAGHTDLILSSSATLAQQIEAGQLRPLVQCGLTRASFLAGVPTAVESGVPDFEATSWYGFFAPAGTPPAVVERFYASVKTAVNEADTRDQIASKFRVDVPLLDPGQLRAVINRQIPMWAEVIRDNNIKGGT
jgi:tripartite-type tricarboxylate transporter receptor subunit TctC